MNVYLITLKGGRGEAATEAAATESDERAERDRLNRKYG